MNKLNSQNNLDDTLSEIVDKVFTSGKLSSMKGYDYLGHEAVLAAIKQAFSEAGYVNPKEMFAEYQREGKIVIQAIDTENNYAPVMTGQEWYDRFDKEMTKDWNGEGYFIYKAIMKVAKKAAGL